MDCTQPRIRGTRIDGREPGRFEPTGLIVTSWLQGTSRDGDPQDHVHNQIARITRTFRDGKWRALDTMSVRTVLSALQAVAATTVECELTREFGVDWIHSAQGATIHTGVALVAGGEDRQWLYPAMTRGTDVNLAFVFTTVKDQVRLDRVSARVGSA